MRALAEWFCIRGRDKRGRDTQAATDPVGELGLTAESKDATETTIEVNSALHDVLDFEDDSEYQKCDKRFRV